MAGTPASLPELLGLLRRGVGEALSRAERELPEIMAPLDEGSEAASGDIISSSLMAVDPGELGWSTVRVRLPGVDNIEVQAFLLEPRSDERPVAGVDGSTRHLNAVSAYFVVSGVAVSYGSMIVGAFPGLNRVPELELNSRPLSIAVPVHVDYLEAVASLRPLVHTDLKGCDNMKAPDEAVKACKRLAHYWGYQRQTMADENRTLLETLALLKAAELDSRMVLVDGPIYATPGLFEKLKSLERTAPMAYHMLLYNFAYAASYALNSLLRAVALKRLAGEGGGRSFLGVVKRLSSSKYLLRAVSLLSSVDLAGYYSSDEEAVKILVSRHKGELGGAAIAIGPIITRIRIGALYERLFELLRARKLVVPLAAGRPGGGVRESRALSGASMTLDSWIDPNVFPFYPRRDYVEGLKAASRVRGWDGNMAHVLLKVAGLLGFRYSEFNELELAKASLYVVVPESPDWSTHYFTFRIEAPLFDEHDADDIARRMLEAAEIVAGEALRSRSGVPLPIASADGYAKSITRMLATSIYRELYTVVGSWDYETRVSIEAE